MRKYDIIHYLSFHPTTSLTAISQDVFCGQCTRFRKGLPEMGYSASNQLRVCFTCYALPVTDSIAAVRFFAFMRLFDPQLKLNTFLDACRPPRGRGMPGTAARVSTPAQRANAPRNERQPVVAAAACQGGIQHLRLQCPSDRPPLPRALHLLLTHRLRRRATSSIINNTRNTRRPNSQEKRKEGST
jgi:hypothetical protein